MVVSMSNLTPDQISGAIVTVLAVARGALIVLDALDKVFPKLKPVADWLGTILGGSKARFGGE